MSQYPFTAHDAAGASSEGEHLPPLHFSSWHCGGDPVPIGGGTGDMVIILSSFMQ